MLLSLIILNLPSLLLTLWISTLTRAPLMHTNRLHNDANFSWHKRHHIYYHPSEHIRQMNDSHSSSTKSSNQEGQHSQRLRLRIISFHQVGWKSLEFRNLQQSFHYECFLREAKSDLARSTSHQLKVCENGLSTSFHVLGHVQVQHFQL